MNLPTLTIEFTHDELVATLASFDNQYPDASLAPTHVIAAMAKMEDAHHIYHYVVRSGPDDLPLIAPPHVHVSLDLEQEANDRAERETIPPASEQTLADWERELLAAMNDAREPEQQTSGIFPSKTEKFLGGLFGLILDAIDEAAAESNADTPDPMCNMCGVRHPGATDGNGKSKKEG
jgi:hypothetical protein